MCNNIRTAMVKNEESPSVVTTNKSKWQEYREKCERKQKDRPAIRAQQQIKQEKQTKKNNRAIVKYRENMKKANANNYDSIRNFVEEMAFAMSFTAHFFGYVALMCIMGIGPFILFITLC